LRGMSFLQQQESSVVSKNLAEEVSF